MQPSFKLLEEQSGVVRPPPGGLPASTPVEGPPFCEFPHTQGRFLSRFLRVSPHHSVGSWASVPPLCLPRGLAHSDTPGVAVRQMIDPTMQNV